MKDLDDIFEKHEEAQKHGYYDDPRWKEVRHLRNNGKNLEANGLVCLIREDWGL